MQLLPFYTSPTARINWVTKEAKDHWEPRLNAASRAFSVLEMQTVAEGVRACATTHVIPQNAEQHLKSLADMGLMFLPIQRVGNYTGFSHFHPPVREGQPWSYYGVVARNPKDAALFAAASSGEVDHTTIGGLLGFPDCCVKFFNEVWKAGYIDPIWQQAESVASVLQEREELQTGKVTTHRITLSPAVHHETSEMLRYIGLRILSHLPCSFDCPKSLEVAEKWISVGKALGVEGLDDLLDMLRWPIEWDCLKGIAVVRTPVFRVTTNSVPCYPRYVVRKIGTVMPEFAGRGLDFPFSAPKDRKTLPA